MAVERHSRTSDSSTGVSTIGLSLRGFYFSRFYLVDSNIETKMTRNKIFIFDFSPPELSYSCIKSSKAAVIEIILID